MIKNQMVATRTPLVAENGLVVGGHELEVEAGVRVMQEGGNAMRWDTALSRNGTHQARHISAGLAPSGSMRTPA